MWTTRPGDGLLPGDGPVGAGLPGPAAVAADPLGSAARLRRARLDPDVLTARALHVVVDAVTLTLLLAVPGLTTLLAAALQPAGPVPTPVPALALAVAGAAVVVGFAVVWPHHDHGRTAGMRWAGLRVVDRSGAAPSWPALALRTLVLPVDLVVGVPLVLLRGDRRRLGDLLAGTQVVRDLSGAPAPARRPGTARSPRARSRTAATPPRR